MLSVLSVFYFSVIMALLPMTLHSYHTIFTEMLVDNYNVYVNVSFCLIAFISRTWFSKVLKNRKYFVDWLIFLNNRIKF